MRHKLIMTQLFLLLRIEIIVPSVCYSNPAGSRRLSSGSKKGIVNKPFLV